MILITSFSLLIFFGFTLYIYVLGTPGCDSHRSHCVRSKG